MRLEQVQWGIIGCGDVTEVKSGPGFQKADNSELVAVMRRNGEKAADYAKRHNVPRWYDDADQLIHDDEVNAVYVATPPSSHKEYAIRAIQAGKPVYIEKPMALDYTECQDILKAADKADIPVYTAFYRRRLPSFEKVKALVNSGAIGQVRFVNMELYWPPRDGDKSQDKHWHVLPEISGGGHFFDLAPHQLDYLDYLFGPISDVQGKATNQAGFYPAEDIVMANFRFESGILASGVWCFTISDHSSTDVTKIVGTEGHIEFPCFGPAELTLVNKDGTEHFSYENPQHVQQPLIQTVVDDLLGKGDAPSTGKSGARTSWVMDEVVKEWKAQSA